MVISGHIRNGVVVLEGGVTLPEGTQVTVLLPVASPIKLSAPTERPRRRIVFPIIPSEHPGSLDITAERIAEVLDQQDASA